MKSLYFKRILIPVLLGLIFAFIYRVWTEPSANQIRDFCSCLYVLENPLDQCQSEIGVKPGRYTIESEVSVVKSKNFETKFISKELGCQEIVETKSQAK